jgi:NAD(P)-dependent dehydrogenase (short-subunit alcohol dehydrogenase family)
MSTLQGHHALVTGAGTGIGAAIAYALAGAGASVTLAGRQKAPLEATARTLSTPHNVVSGFDVTDPAAVAAGLAAARAALGPVSLLVNNAGAAESAPFGKTDAALLRRMLAVNLEGAFSVTQAALADLLARGAGARIINIASTAGLKGYAYVTAYCAAKHAMVGFTRALALELAATGVTVNAVCPGFTDTPLVARSVAEITGKTGKDAAAARAALARHNPQGRLVTPEEVANTVLWLASPAAQAVTGQAIAVAGGEIMT